MPDQPNTPGKKSSIFVFLADLFERHAVHPVLVGGYAAMSYGAQRTTFDIDFMMGAEEVVTLFREYGAGELHARLVALVGGDT
ncbi:MAG: hypothetical protein GF331_10825 [Chitinivibrionales bacterium]|nr:hypothetical protein [Chitinivibrionales bacterium]